MLLRRPARLHRPPVRAGGAGSRRARRRSWLGRALAATAACQLIFADPDNGIRPAGHREPSHRAEAVKHAYLDELAAFAQRGQSLVVYHHADRSATVDQQARRGLTDLTRGVPVQPVAAVRACRGSNRLFLIGAASAAHSRYLTGRLTAFQHGPMGRGTHRVLARLTSDVTGTVRDVAFTAYRTAISASPFHWAEHNRSPLVTAVI